MVPRERLEAIAMELAESTRERLPATTSILVMICDEDPKDGKMEWGITWRERSPISILRLIRKARQLIERRILGE